MNNQKLLLLNQAASALASRRRQRGSARYDLTSHCVVFEATCDDCKMGRRINVPELKLERIQFVKGVLGGELTSEVADIIRAAMDSLRCPMCDKELLARPLPREAAARMNEVRRATGASTLSRDEVAWDRIVREAMARIEVRRKFVDVANLVGPMPSEKYVQIVHLHEGQMVVPAEQIASADVTLCARWLDTQRAREWTPDARWSGVLANLRVLVERAQAARHEVEEHASRPWESGALAERWLVHELGPLLDTLARDVEDAREPELPIGKAPKNVVAMHVEPGMHLNVGAAVCVSASGKAMPLTRDEAVIGFVVGDLDHGAVAVALKD